MDLDARWRLQPGWGGPIDLNASVSYMDRYRVQASEGDDWTVLTGTLNNPRVRGNLGAKWIHERWTVGSTLNDLSGFKSTLANQACTGPRLLGICQVAEDITLDLFGSWMPNKQLTLRGTVRNVADSRMPVTPTVPTGNRYWYSAQGRAFSISAAYSF